MNDVPASSYRPAPEGVGRGRFAVRRTRLGGWWVALIASAVVLLLLLIFVLQNGHSRNRPHHPATPARAPA